MERAQRRGRRRLFLVAVGAVVAVALALEGAVRVRQYVRHGTTAPTVFRWRVDEATGLRLPAPDQRTARLSTNALGLRGAEVAVPKPPGTVRLAFVGASTTFCAEVGPDAATWPELVVAGLAERFPDRRFDLVNAGVPGFTVETSQRLFEARIAALEPDVVLVLHATNDLTLDTRRLARTAGFRDVAGEEDRGLARWSLAWRLVEKNLAARRNAERARSGTGALAIDAKALASAFGARYEALLRLADAHAERVVALTFAHRMRREQEIEARLAAGVTNLLYMPYLSTDAILDGYDAYNRAIVEAAWRAGALAVDGHDWIPGDAAHFADSVHFTAQGCRRMADRVLAALLDDPGFNAIASSH